VTRCVPRRRKVLLFALVGYLALQFDLVPDFIPVAGQLDDVVVVALVLRSPSSRRARASHSKAMAGAGTDSRNHFAACPVTWGLRKTVPARALVVEQRAAHGLDRVECAGQFSVRPEVIRRQP